MAQLAWLNTGARGKDGKAGKTRLELVQADQLKDTPVGLKAEYPPLDCFAYLPDYLFEVGPGQSGGMGPAVLSHTELAAWQANTGIVLDAWEVRTLRTLSSVYLHSASEAEDGACKPPFVRDVQQEQQRQSIDLRASMRALVNL